MLTQLIMNNLVFLIGVLILGAAGLIVLIYGLVNINKSEDVVGKRMQDFVVNQDRPNQTSLLRRILPREVNGSFFSRTIVPFAKGIVEFFGRYTPANAIPKLERSLAIAGNPMGLHAQSFYGIRVIILLAGIFTAFLLNYKTTSLDIGNLLLGIGIIILCLGLPTIWLNSKVHNRQDEFRRNLPDALDMLSVCATAGLGFDQSIKKITEYWPTALGGEFKRALQEMDMGLTRTQALRNMSDRLDVDELSSFIAIIIQAESMGMSFADVLHSQAKQMRVLRQYRAKEIANKMPAKMIIPLAAFIFPALIAVILGPIIPTILDLF
jgi:tight adherence protein C